MTDAHRAYFEDQALNSNPEFWRRFGQRPSFAGQRILDLGCGHGAMSLEMALAGGRVVGVDLDTARISWARDEVAPQNVSGSLEFVVADVRTLGLQGQFDIVVSKDTFEHVEDLESVLIALRDALSPRGQIWAGFSPLYYSPRGDHSRTGLRVPWAHALLPRAVVYAAATRYRGKPTRSLSDVGLNGMTPKRFRELVAAAGLRFESVRFNPGDKRGLKALRYVRRFAPLERYATVGIYAILVREHS
jgi:ubiquinone/menaquinone biosynthesis C-methylase UbiE